MLFNIIHKLYSGMTLFGFTQFKLAAKMVSYNCSSKALMVLGISSLCRKGLVELGLLPCFSSITLLFLVAMAAHSASNGSSRIEFWMFDCHTSPAVWGPDELLVEVGELNPLEVPALALMCSSTVRLMSSGLLDTKDDIFWPSSKLNKVEVVEDEGGFMDEDSFTLGEVGWSGTWSHGFASLSGVSGNAWSLMGWSREGGGDIE